jgi:phage terminase large subunit-like protein
MLIFFVAEDPFGANDVLALRRRLKDSHIIVGEVVQLFLHCQQPIRILECFLYTHGLNKEDKRVMFNK